MRLDMQRETERMQRQGLARRTILAVIWFGICTVAAYFMVQWLFDNEFINMSFFYNRLHIPRSIDQTIIIIGFIIFIVLVMQFFVLIGYAIFSPVGRRRPGDASARPEVPDPFDDGYDYQ